MRSIAASLKNSAVFMVGMLCMYRMEMAKSSVRPESDGGKDLQTPDLASPQTRQQKI